MTSQPEDEWCGHTGRYQVTAMLCGRRGYSDRLMRCEECGQEYLASYLASVRPHERGRETEGGPAMSGPARTGNPASRQKAQKKDEQRIEQLGDGWITGNIGQEPELRYTPTGRAVCKLTVAHTPRTKNDDTGKWEDGDTIWYGVDIWGDQGENVAECLTKGDRVIIGGEFRERTYTTREGEERTVQEITAREIGPSMLFLQVQVKRRRRSSGRQAETEG